MRRGLLWLLLPAVIVVLVWVAAATPLGWHTATSLLERALSDRTGLDVEIGSLEGNLLRRINVENVSLFDPGGLTIARVGTISASYNALALLRRRIAISELIIDDADLLFDVDPTGDVVGWSRLAVADTSIGEGSSSVGGWTIDARVAIRDLNATVVDTARGLSVRVTGVTLDAAGGMEAYEVAVSGSVRVVHPAISAPFDTGFETRLAGSATNVAFHSLVRGDVARVAIQADLAFPEEHHGEATERPGSVRIADGSFDADILLEDLSRLFETPGLAGDLRIEGVFGGAADSLGYDLRAVSERVAYNGTELEGLAVEVTGDPLGSTVERLVASLGGGSVTASGSWHAPSSRDPRAHGGIAEVPVLVVSAELRGVDLSAVIPEAGEASTHGGRLDLDLRLSADTLAPTGLRGEGHAQVGGLAIAGRTAGDLVAEFAVEGTGVTASGSCCGMDFEVDATLSESGVDSIGFEARIADLAVPAAALGIPRLRGSGEVGGAVLRPATDPAVRARARFPGLYYGDVDVGPVTADVSGRAGVYDFAASAFSGAVTADGSFAEFDGVYETAVTVEGLALERALSDSIRELLGLTGSVSADVVVRGDTSGAFSVGGTVTHLTAAVGEERMTLERPASFRSRRVSGETSISFLVDEFALSGTLGRLEAVGGIGDSLDVTVLCENVDLAAAFAAASVGSAAAPPRGILEGSFEAAGQLSAPRFTADAAIADLGFGDIDIGRLLCEVETDGSDVLFAVDVAGAAGGAVSASGLVPVATDTTGATSIDPEREFGISVACSSFVLDAEAWLLPDIRGRKTISLDGSALVTGRGDTLTTLNGMGALENLDVRFEAVEFHLEDPAAFRVVGGDVELDTLTVSVDRRRVLGQTAAGTLKASGRFERDGALSAAFSADSLEVESLIRAFAPHVGEVLGGALRIDVTIEGTVERPEYVFSWAMRRPTIYGIGFDRLEGSGRGDARAIVLDRAALVTGGESATVSGTIPLGSPFARGGRGPESAHPEESSPGEFDLRIRADEFRLDALGELPLEVGELDGVLDVDLSVGGRADDPTLDGAATMRGGEMRSPGFEHRIRDVRFDLRADGRTIVLVDGSGRLGDGAVTFSGFTQLGADGVFWASADLDGAEFGIEDMFSATLGGKVRWVGNPTSSEVSGKVIVEEAEVTYSVGLDDVLRRRRPPIVVRRSGNSLDSVALDLDVSIADRVLVRSNVARADLMGGFHIGGNALVPRISGSIVASEGTFNYMDREFALETLNIRYIDPRRRDPYVELSGVAEVESRAGDLYVVTLRFDGFLFEGMPELTSVPPLSPPDIVSLLTFGDTFGAFVASGEGSGSSRDRFAALARTAFVSSVFGIAETTLERLLRLDTVALDEKAFEERGIVGSDVTFGKEFGGLVSVQYTTPLGRFEERKVEVSLRLTRMLSVETRADPEGNHAIGLKLRIPFK